ncbi:hypothetical protein ACFL0F_00665 [Patescibacteria group bacterium]
MNQENQNTDSQQPIQPIQSVTPVTSSNQSVSQTNTDVNSQGAQNNEQGTKTKSPSEYKKIANLWLIIGFLIWLAGNAVRQYYLSMAIIGWLLFLIGFSMFIFGCMNYVKAKGYHWAFGLLGILSLIGLIILVLLPNKNKVLDQSA